MPAKFTKAFAERLDRTTPWHVREAEPGDAITAGLRAGGAGLGLARRCGARALTLKVDILPPQPDDRYVPSVDRMLEPAAPQAMRRRRCCAIVLTGMGGDGGRGVQGGQGSRRAHGRRGARDRGHLRHAAGGDRHRRRRRGGAAAQHPRADHPLRAEEVALKSGGHRPMDRTCVHFSSAPCCCLPPPPGPRRRIRSASRSK